MTVISTQKDAEALTLTFVAEFDAPVERIWQVWEDPRQLERWWGPPTWPATFEQHDFTVGGRSRYYMTGPDGEKAPGWWQITAIDAPHHLEFDDGFADENGEPVTTMDPVHTTVTFEATGTGTRMVSVSAFTTTEQLEQLLAMGMEEGLRLAMGQIDELLTGTEA
ncbi:SRPBCC domain-containing protein [Saccharopolyspora sp. K220]|uniref:SRPBCC family protein n=1 Tax=Saccharopolyspora soli TaxID=2926618 RepID=UPI001F57330A|nr:SRPBCC domain-containing protein [Saccharopolyspora soli]MCI2418932.1 SRPBCC domain-containing protein [Saccharopolyspora soli]